MRARLRIARAVALLALFGLGCRSRGAAQAHPAKPAASVAHAPLSADPELAAAERAAIARLPEFRAVVTRAEPATQAFEVEAVVKDGALSERLWLGDVKAVAGGFEGSVNTEPKQLKSIRRAQSLRVADEDVVDWAYYERRTLHGAETRRIALEQRRRAELADALTHCGEAKFADGCAALGDTYAAGVLFERRPEVALELYTKACAGGSTYGCNAAGWAVFHGRGGAQDLPAAAAFFARACTTGDEHPFGCDSRGFALLTGLAGTKRDVPLALRFLGKTCAKGLAPSCLLLELAKVKRLRSGPKLELACDVNFAEQVSRCTSDQDPEGCFLAGSAIETGICGVPKSAKRSADLLEKAAAFGAEWPGATRAAAAH